MTRKFISLATAIVTLDVYLRSQLYSNDPLFLFASSGLAINIGMVAIAACAVAVSFMNRFKSWYSYAACTAAAVLFIVGGLAGAMLSDVAYAFSNLLLPLDYLFILQAGIVGGLCSLSYKHASMPFQIKTPNLAGWLNKIVLPVPKIPHSPTRFSNTSAASGTR